jgi:hypothetical protein
VCDLADRIILVDDRSVSVLRRPKLTRARAPIRHVEKLGDRCGGPDGGHAGCSIAYRRVQSAVLGHHTLELGNNPGNHLDDDDQPNQVEECRYVPEGTIATCSTATRFVTVAYVAGPSSPPCWHLQATLWEGDRATALDAELDRAGADSDDRWVARLPARDMTLRFDRHAAVLEAGAKRELCVAFRLAP